MGKEEFYGLQYPQMKIDYDFLSQFLIGKVELNAVYLWIANLMTLSLSSQFLIGKVERSIKTTGIEIGWKSLNSL